MSIPGSDDWRQIRDFHNYMINPDGDIRNTSTGLLIRPVLSGGSPYVRLFRHGRVYNRSVRKLIERAYPHVEIQRTYEQWWFLPGFENYEINEFGRVRKVKTKRELTVYTDSGVYVNLYRDGRTCRRSIAGLLRSVGVGE